MLVGELWAMLTRFLPLCEVLMLKFQKSLGPLKVSYYFFCYIFSLLGSFILHNHSFDLIHPNVRTTFFIRYVYIIGQKANLNLLLESLARL